MNPQKNAKKTVYVDVDEEITSVIDKVRSSSESIIALVVPKRAAMFLSVVNMKLLKRAADQNNKKVVLITSNRSVLPLAGIAGIHVAANLSSKPYIPVLPTLPEDVQSMGSEEAIEIGAQTAGENIENGEATDDVSSIAIDNTSKAVGAIAQKQAVGTDAKKIKKAGRSKLRVPDFKKFRTVLIIGIAVLILLIVGGYYALAIAPKATVTLRGETKAQALSFDVSADTAATALDTEKSVVPSKPKEIKKTETEKVPATGQKDKGNKASGTVALRNCSDNPINVPAGTGVSSGDLTFITQTAVALEEGDFTSGGVCKSSTPTKDVSVIAQQAGDKYNVSERSYIVAGFSKVTGAGSATAGGTSQVVKVVAASDIENAKQKLASKQAGATEELKAALNAEEYIGLVDTFASSGANFIPTPAVDSEANEVIVSVQITYTMIGLKKDDLKKLIEAKATKDGGIDNSRQSILDDGLKSLTFQLGAVNGTVTTVTVKTTIIAGPKIDQEAIKQEIAGKKRGVAEQLLAGRPGIKEVRIDTKPFWNYSVPKKTQKINFIIEESNDFKQPTP